MSLRKFRAGRIATANAATWVGEYGVIFYNEATGALRISDGTTPGGNPLALVASDFNFTFGDFEATTPADGSATLSSANPDQDINIYSNGDGAVNIVGQFNVFPPDGDIYSRNPIFRVSNDGQVRMLVPHADSAEGAFTVVGGLDAVFQPPVNEGVMVHVTGIAGTPGVPSRIYNDAQNAFGAFVTRRYNGTAASPTAVLNGEEIMRLSGTAHNGTNIPGTANTRIVFTALGNQTLTNQGGTMEFWATPQNSTTLAKVASVDNANGLTSTQFVGPLKGSVKSTNTGNTVLDTSASTATFTGNVTGNVSGTAGSVAAANITGTTLASNVTGSSLTSTGTLTNLVVAGTMRYDGAQNNATAVQPGTPTVSKSNPVTCNGRTGQITTNAGTIARNLAATFTVTNSFITDNRDVVVVCLQSGATADSYAVAVTNVNGTAHTFNITLSNNGTGALTDTIVINFAILKVS